MDLKKFYFDFLYNLVKFCDATVFIEKDYGITNVYYYHIIPDKLKQSSHLGVIFIENKIYAWKEKRRRRKGRVVETFETSLDNPNSLNLISKYILEHLND